METQRPLRHVRRVFILALSFTIGCGEQAVPLSKSNLLGSAVIVGTGGTRTDGPDLGRNCVVSSDEAAIPQANLTMTGVTISKTALAYRSRAEPPTLSVALAGSVEFLEDIDSQGKSESISLTQKAL